MEKPKKNPNSLYFFPNNNNNKNKNVSYSWYDISILHEVLFYFVNQVYPRRLINMTDVRRNNLCRVSDTCAHVWRICAREYVHVAVCRLKIDRPFYGS